MGLSIRQVHGRPNQASRPTRPIAFAAVSLDPLYVDVIVRRFEAATGNQAVLVETGKTVEALATQGWNRPWLRPVPAVGDVADEEREAATGQARGCLHCGGQRFESPPLHSRKSA